MAKITATTKMFTVTTCRQMTDLVLDYLNGRLSQKVKRDFERHLAICPDCVSFFNTYRKTVAETRSVDPAEMPAKVRDNILAFLRKRIRRVVVFLLSLAAHLTA